MTATQNFFDLEDVLDQTARLLGISPLNLLRHAPGSRDQHNDARAVGMYAVHIRCGLSFPETGRLFGRHHTTVMAACARVQASGELFLKARHVAEGLTPIEGGVFT